MADTNVFKTGAVMDYVNNNAKVVTEEEYAKLENAAEKGKVVQQAAMTHRTRTIVREYNKIGRNEKCPCGSGKKYKNCCLSTGTYEKHHELTVVEASDIKNNRTSYDAIKKTAKAPIEKKKRTRTKKTKTEVEA